MVLIGGLIGITIAVVIGVNLLPTIANAVSTGAGGGLTGASGPWVNLVTLLPLVVAAIIIIGAVSYISNK